MKNKTTVGTQYRQGDVLIERINKLPEAEKLKVVAREHGRVVLAHGEVTGHAHAIADAGTEKLVDDAGREFFRVKGQRIGATLPIVRVWRGQVMVNHPRLGVIEFAASDIDVEGDVATIDGDFALLTHDEHNAHAIPAGLYRGGNAADGKVYQREYSPEAIRRVAD